LNDFFRHIFINDEHKNQNETFYLNNNLSTNIEVKNTEFKQTCGHILTIYIIPNIFHFAFFVMGFVYFRVKENEQLYSLVEKVFLVLKNDLQDKIVKRLR
jgi:hypothetical protein